MSKKAIFDKKNVLVTGGAGFIGSYLCEELLRDSKVICIDNYITGSEKNIDHLLANPDFEFIRHDINEPINIEKLPGLQKFKIEFQGIQEIYNLACPTSPKNFVENTLNTALTNSVGLNNVLNIAKEHEAKFMHFSSSVVYGQRTGESVKVDESYIGKSDILSERSSYDEGKRFAETLVKTFSDKYNLDAKILRVFRTFGPRMKVADNQMIPDFIENALDGNDLVILGDENFSSTFCYVTDIVDAAIQVMDTNFAGPYNVGSDVIVKVSDLAQKIIELTGSDSKITYSEPEMFMTQLPVPDISRIRTDIGWMPIMTQEQSLKKTINIIKTSRGVKDLSSIV